MPRILLLIACISLFAMGCVPNHPTAANPNSVTTPVPTTLPLPAANLTVPEQVAVAEVVEAPSEPEVEGPQGPENPPQRLLVFTTQGPIRVDVRLWIDGSSFDLSLEHLIDHVLELADTNKDGEATWDELADQPEIQSGQLGNLSFENPQERTRLINLYDTNRNNRVDRSEVPRLVTRNRGQGQAFSVRQTSYAADRSRSNSPVRNWLDSNGNGLITPDEIKSANRHLRARDLNDDEIVTSRELSPQPQQMVATMPNNDRRRFFGNPAMFTLDEQTEWNEAFYALQEIYRVDSPIALSRFAKDSVLHQIDLDDSGMISDEEFKSIGEAQALVTVDIRFGSLEEGRSRVELVRDELTVTNSMEVRTRIGTDWLVIRARDSVESQFGQRQIDQFFQIYDADQNDYLDEDEWIEQAFQIPFDQADRNDDEMVFKKEIVAALNERNWIRRCQIRLQGIDGEDGLLRHLDQNQDSRLSAREITVAKNRLKDLDQNGDGNIEFGELPASHTFEFFRGDDNANPTPAASFAFGNRVTQEPSKAPKWFTGMDYNDDGDISPREFLGTSDQFQSLDVNDDGFLSLNETLPATDRGR